MNRLLRLAAAAAAVAVVVAACGGSDDPDDSSAPPAAASSAAAATTSAPGGGEGTAATAAITIKDFKYGDPLTVAPGTVITVTNEDTAGHDVVSDDADKFKTPVLGKGESATFTAPSEPGTYKFSCSLHPGSMSGIGTLIVSG
jgi:plastocyanin